MYKPEIILKSTEKLKNQIKFDYEKWKEFQEKGKEFIKSELGVKEKIIEIEPEFDRPFFWVKLDKKEIEKLIGKQLKVLTFDAVKFYYSKINPHLKVIKVEENEEGISFARLTVNRQTKEGKKLSNKWSNHFEEYEQPVLRYIFGIYLNTDVRHLVHWHQVDEENLIVFVSQDKKHIAEKLIETGNWKRTYVKLINNPPNYARDFNKELKRRLSQQEK